MKILLDECLNWRLKSEFNHHEVYTVQDMGWSGIVNGELLTRASQAGFGVFITIDKNLRYQQNLSAYSLAVVIIQTRINRLEYILPMLPDLLKKIPDMMPGEVYEIGQ